MKINVIKKRCPQNHTCPAINVYPVSAIKQVGFLAPSIDDSKCINCGKCTLFCPMGAIINTK